MTRHILDCYNARSRCPDPAGGQRSSGSGSDSRRPLCWRRIAAPPSRRTCTTCTTCGLRSICVFLTAVLKRCMVVLRDKPHVEHEPTIWSSHWLRRNRLTECIPRLACSMTQEPPSLHSSPDEHLPPTPAPDACQKAVATLADPLARLILAAVGDGARLREERQERCAWQRW